MILHGCFLFPSFVQVTEGLLGNQARGLPVTWDSQLFGSSFTRVSDVERGHPLRELTFFITSKSGVGNSFSCLWDWNMLVARRIKGVFQDSNYLQHSEYLSTPPKRFKNKYPIQQGFPKDSQDYLWFFPHQTRKPFSRDFFVRIDPNKRPPLWLGEFGPWSKVPICWILVICENSSILIYSFLFFFVETLMV